MLDMSFWKKESQEINVDSPRFISTLKRALEKMFKEADVEGRGLLTYEQFKDSFKTLAYDINDDDILMMVALADENEHCLIPYNEFIPIALDLVRTIYRRNLRGDNMPVSKDALK